MINGANNTKSNYFFTQQNKKNVFFYGLQNAWAFNAASQ